jgi:IS5 family transposase
MTKNKKTVYGYKIHTKQDFQTQLITKFKLTLANVHDSQINLCKRDEIDFKDKAYFKRKYHQFNGCMTRAVRNHPLIIWEKLRNKRISRKRAPVERPYSFLKRINNSHTKLTTSERNQILITILMMIFNIEQLITLQKEDNADEENDGVLYWFFNRRGHDLSCPYISASQ